MYKLPRLYKYLFAENNYKELLSWYSYLKLKIKDTNNVLQSSYISASYIYKSSDYQNSIFKRKNASLKIQVQPP